MMQHSCCSFDICRICDGLKDTSHAGLCMAQSLLVWDKRLVRCWKPSEQLLAMSDNFTNRLRELITDDMCVLDGRVHALICCRLFVCVLRPWAFF